MQRGKKFIPQKRIVAGQGIPCRDRICSARESDYFYFQSAYAGLSRFPALGARHPSWYYLCVTSNRNPIDRQMKLAIAQINCIVGDLERQYPKNTRLCQSGEECGSQLVITPRDSRLSGYPPEDLLFATGFRPLARNALTELAQDRAV